jgi:hypothetical protein
MKKLFIDKRTFKSGKKSFLNVSTTLDLFKYIKSVGGSVEFVEQTYNSLLSKVNAGTLVPGTYYVITDYQTCYNQPDYDQFKNPIAVSNASYVTTSVDPIIVFATSTSTLAPDAYQPSYPNDKIKYDIFYSTTESGDPAFGRITERIDEFGNRADYDHRTIQFKRYMLYTYSKVLPLPGTVELQSDGTVLGTLTTFTSLLPKQIIAIKGSTETFYEIDTITDDFTMTVTGEAITATGAGFQFFNANSHSDDSYYPNNVNGQVSFTLYYTFQASVTFGGDGCINTYIGDHAKYVINEGIGDFLLANNVLKDGAYRNNTIGDSSYNNTFNDDCTANQIGYGFRNNITDDDFDENVIGTFFENNIITANFYDNHIGNDFNDNFILCDSFYRNQIGNDFRDNWLDGDFGFDFQNNQIGNQFNNNEIYKDFYKNVILNGYNQNQIWDQFIGNKIGNGFNANQIFNNFYDNHILDYFTSNIIGDATFAVLYSFNSNIINNSFQNNTILGNFFKNNIGNNFSANNIGFEFRNNLIGSDFSSNDLGDNFGYNVIGNTFQNNVIGNDFGYGGSATRGNKIGNTFVGNNIGENFYDNVISDLFINNIIVDNFKFNHISYSLFGFDFTTATHVYADYNCKIIKSSDTSYYLEYLNIVTPTYVAITA